MQRRQIQDPNLLPHIFYDQVTRYINRGGGEIVLELIKECINEDRINELKPALQQPYFIVFFYHCKTNRQPAWLRYIGNFYQKAISCQFLEEHLTFLKKHNLIPDND